MDFNLDAKKLLAPNNIKVSVPKQPNQLLIVWDLVKNPDENKNPSVQPLIVNVRYNIYRSTSLNGIFYKLNNKLLATCRFEDTSVGRNPNTQYFYKISTVAEYDDGEIIEGDLSNPVIFHIPTTNKWFIKVNERNMWILKNTGVLMDLYVRKTQGPRCSICWDPIRSQADADCKTCYGTTYEGGYEPMTQLYIRQKPNVQQLDLTAYGYSPNSNPGAWTISNIQIKNRDLLINSEGKIFTVTSSQISHAAGYLFHQELTMKELDPTDRLYSIKRATLYPEW